MGEFEENMEKLKEDQGKQPFDKYLEARRELDRILKESLHTTNSFKGPKEKEDKPDWSIFPFDEAEHVLRVFEYGAKKYGKPFTYRHLVPPDDLLAAAIRHLICIQNGFSCDRESDLLHWAHVAANALMALSHYRKVKI